MDLNAVRILVEVVDRGSFTAAAQAVGLPTSSVSRRVAQLERDLGVMLLARTTRKLSLTEAGRIYLDRAREAVRSLTEAGEVASEAGREPRGRVRVTSPGDIAGIVAPAMVAFSRAHPGIEIDLLVTSRQVDFVDDAIDLAIRGTGGLRDSSLVARRVGTTPLRLYAAPSYLAEHGTPRRVADLARHRCVLYRGQDSTARWVLDGPRGTEMVEVRGWLSADDMSMCRHAAIAGGGIALLPTGVATQGPPGALVVVLPRHAVMAGALFLVHAGGRILPRRVALLRDFLHEWLQRLVEPASGDAPGR